MLCHRTSQWKRKPAAPGATKTRRFLTHCRGRHRRTRPLTSVGRCPVVRGGGVFVGRLHRSGRGGQGVLCGGRSARGCRAENTMVPQARADRAADRDVHRPSTGPGGPRRAPCGLVGQPALSICLREAPVSSGSGQTGPGRARPWGQGDRPGAARRGLRGHLHRPPPDRRAGGAGGHPGGRRRGGPLPAVGRPSHPGPPGGRRPQGAGPGRCVGPGGGHHPRRRHPGAEGDGGGRGVHAPAPPCRPSGRGWARHSTNASVEWAPDAPGRGLPAVAGGTTGRTDAVADQVGAAGADRGRTRPESPTVPEQTERNGPQWISTSTRVSSTSPGSACPSPGAGWPTRSRRPSPWPRTPAIRWWSRRR